MDMVIVTGLSGAGKSKAINALEDIGFFCVDNMPPALIPSFAEVSLQSNAISKIAVVTDIRGGELFNGIFDCIDKLKKNNINFKILFLDSENEVLEKRFKESRRMHPLSQTSQLSVSEAIEKERGLLQPIYDIADYTIDTSLLSVAQERERIISIFKDDAQDGFQITVVSFGFKFGIPTDSDLVFDVRCLANPFYVDKLKRKTGLDPAVVEYINADSDTAPFIDTLFDFLKISVPMFKREGKSELIISVGCTGGKHRSVAVAEMIYSLFAQQGMNIKVSHRDIDKQL